MNELHHIPARGPRASRRRAAAFGDAGFTMIEMLVAMVVLAIVMAFAIGGLIDGFQSSNKNLSSAKAQSLANRISARLASDLRSANAPDRNYENLREPVLLRDYLMNGTPISHPLTGATLEHLDDVLVASSDRFQFYSDVTASPGPECVEYRVGSQDGRTIIERGVAPGPACGGFQWSILQPPSDAEVEYLFSYRLVCGVGGVGCGANCAPSGLLPAGNTGELAPRQLNFISSVSVNVETGFDRGESSAKGGSGAASSEVGLRTRQNGDYRYAIGCEVAG